MKWPLVTAAVVSLAAGTLLYLRWRSTTTSLVPAPPPITVRVPVLGLVYYDVEFSRWSLVNYHVWSEVYEDEVIDVSPSVIVEYINESDPLRPQFNIVVEDQVSPCTAQEYVERQQMPQSTVDILPAPLLELGPNERIDVATCAFGETEDNGALRRVINVILVMGNTIIVLQLITRSDATQYMPLFMRLCTGAMQQLEQSDLVRRSLTNELWFCFPSARPKSSGYAVSVPSRRCQLMSLSHPNCRMIAEMFQPYDGLVRAAFVDRDEIEGTAMFSIQFASSTMFKKASNDLPSQFADSGLHFKSDEKCLCITAMRSTNAEAVARHLGDVRVKKSDRSKASMEYRHRPTGISYAMSLDQEAQTDSPSYILHSFGPFDVQWHPNGRDRSISLRMAVRSLSTSGCTFMDLQRQALQRYDEGQLSRYPSVDRWCRFDAQVVSADGQHLTEHVAILEHERHFVHVVWTYPKGRMTHTLFMDRVRRELLLPRWSD